MTTVDGPTPPDPKPATSARIYDHFLGGVRNFPADRDAARRIVATMPAAAGIARANRAFVRRAVRHLAAGGVRQFLDLGSGMPTQGNVHDIAAEVTTQARVVYVDNDPVAVAESLEILDRDPHTTAIHADIRKPDRILTHPQVCELIDITEPVGILMTAVLHFIPDDEEANGLVTRLLEAVPDGSHFVISYGTTEGGLAPHDPTQPSPVESVYRTLTATPTGGRTRAQIAAFFAGTSLVDPGLVWLPDWRPAPHDRDEFQNAPHLSSVLAGMGRK